MNDNRDLQDFHIGNIIREMAGRQGVAAAALAAVLEPPRYRGNEEKIFRVKDLNIGDVLRISRALHYNLLKTVSDAFLAHIPFTGRHVMQAFDAVTLDFRTGRYQFHRYTDGNRIKGGADNPDSRRNPDGDGAEAVFRFLRDFHIGDYCREVARAKNMNGKFIARRMGCSAGSVRYYFLQKDMKLGTAVMLSRALEHNLIAEIYLIRTDFGGTPLFGDGSFDSFRLFGDGSFDVAMRAEQPFSTGNVAGDAFVRSFSTQKSEKKQVKNEKKSP